MNKPERRLANTSRCATCSASTSGTKVRPSSNAPLLAHIVARAGASLAYVEWVGPRPTDGAVEAFTFGRCREASSRAFWPPSAFLRPS
jgi:hypothetical protein